MSSWPPRLSTNNKFLDFSTEFIFISLLNIFILSISFSFFNSKTTVNSEAFLYSSEKI